MLANEIDKEEIFEDEIVISAKKQIDSSEITRVKEFSLNNSCDEVDMDKIYNEIINPNGLWQWIIVIACSLTMPASVIFPVFANTEPMHRCKLSNEAESALEHLINKNEKLLCGVNNTQVYQDECKFFKIVELIEPDVDNEFNHGRRLHIGTKGCYQHRLDLYNISLIKITNYSLSKDRLKNAPIERCQNGYIYHKLSHQYGYGLVEEWNLICSQSWKIPISTSVYMLGMVIGFIVGGWLGDFYGRRKLIVYGSVIEIIFGFPISLVNNYVSYCILRFIIGATFTAKVTAVTVLTMEITTANFRSIISSTSSMLYAYFQRVLLAFMAYFITNWRWLNFAQTALNCLIIFTLWIIPESPRWLVSQKKNNELVDNLYRAFKINNFKLIGTKNALLTKIEFKKKIRITTDTREKLSLKKSFKSLKKIIHQPRNIPRNPNDNGGFCTKYFKCFGTKHDSLKMILAIFIFSVQTMTYFGILLYARSIRSHVCFVVLINSFFGIVGSFLSGWLYHCFRYRKRPVIGTFTGSFLALLVGSGYTLFFMPETDIVLTVCSNIAIVLLTASMRMLFIYVPELFTSDMRSSAFGISSGIGRAAGAFCPLINSLNSTLRHGFPLLIYSGLCLVAIVLLFFLNDTDGERLLDNVETKSDDIFNLKVAVIKE